ncbi:MAG TPA: DUF934 domain-containing protein [Methylotenera sp.]|nr:DUF934 domain-containing protein [Methylotenera sp.]
MSNLKPSNLILKNQIVADDWTLVELPKVDQEVRMQAGKVVLFKLTGENTTTVEQIANTVIPATGKVLLPLSVYLARKGELTSRVKDNEIGIWLATHEVLENLAATEPNLNVFPLIAVYVERFADGRIFSLGNLLRTRYNFNNTLRAFGDVLRDQLFFLKRSGFDSYLIRADRSAEEALQSLKDFTHPYQGAVDNNQPVWRRVHRSA